MSDTKREHSDSGTSAGFAGGGAMGDRIAAIDWSATSLGPVERWPQTLRSALSIGLNSNFPIAIYWGSDLVLLYNDQWSPILGEKHPWALGRPAREAWPEIWDIIEPLFQQVMQRGESTRSRDQLLPMHRHGFTEECYFDYTFSPIRSERGAVEGVFNAVLETTTRVIGERRLRTLRELGAWKTGDARTAQDACHTAARILNENPHDLPFVLLYLLDNDGRHARLAGSTGVAAADIAGLEEIHLDAPDAPWPLKRVVEVGRAVDVAPLPTAFQQLSGAAWPEPARRAVVLPMAKSGQSLLAGFVVAGISPRLALNDDYRGFLDLLASHIAAAVDSARAYAEERRRAEALAELDRAKTAFFSNVSHEFRTPLTLMLVPIEDMLAQAVSGAASIDREMLKVVYRNGQRLQRLVNMLLDFSRIEAGRAQAVFEPTDLAAFTAELASNFRSACDRAGLELDVDCPPLDEPVFVDRQMWEKVVLNLLSNAFKFTFDGRIAVSMAQADAQAVLRIEDTGTGIPEHEMPRLFERFHRIENARGRTHEGSGIGLALVQELVKLHGGAIEAESQVDQGTTFLVRIPLGSGHLPREQLRTHAASTHSTDGASPFVDGASPFVDEALRWLPDGQPATGDADGVAGNGAPMVRELADAAPENAHAKRPRVLVVDDNADMRHYVARLLAGRYEVETAIDGQVALEVARRQCPDLIVSDVMMPRVDGFGLLRALRADPQSSSVPVILLSARAGEDSRVEGMEAGADDYLVKPFSARELLASVSAHLQIARQRQQAEAIVRESEQRLRGIFDQAVAGIAQTDLAGRFVRVNARYCEIVGRSHQELLHLRMQDVTHPEDLPRNIELFSKMVQDAGPPFVIEKRYVRPDGSTVWVSNSVSLVGNERGEPEHTVAVTLDISARKRAEEERERLFAVGADLLVVAGFDGYFQRVSPTCERTLGWTAEEMMARPWADFLHPDDRPLTLEVADRLMSGQQLASFENRYRHKDGTYRWFGWKAMAYPREQILYAGATDITDRKTAEEGLRRSEIRERLRADELETVLSAVPAVVWIAHDPQCHRITGNFASSEFLRLPHDANQSMSAPDREKPRHFQVMKDGQPLRPEEMPVQMAARGMEVRDFEEEVVFDDGTRNYLFGHAIPLHDETGQVRGSVAAFVDISDRKRAEQERERLLEKLQRQDRRKDEFLATLAHELRNPLAPLRSGLQVLRMSGAKGEFAEQACLIMERQLGQMVHLVDDLLDLSRISRGKIELRKKRMELSKAIQQAVETSRPAIETAGHDLVIDMPAAPIYIEADLTRMAQVLSNLLNNAAKYTDRGGCVTLAVERQDGEAVISVRDNGMGIPESMLPHVFEMFTQVDRNLERAQGGLGIGLSIVKRLVEMHGGSVTASSAGHGQGSEFVVRLPAADPISAATIDSARPQRAGTQRRVLVVDDNRDAAISLAMMLRVMGNETRTAHDGLEALEVAPEYQPDLILLDIGMPRLNGYDTARRIREQDWGKDIVIVALTGWGQEEDRRRSHAAGFDAHMTKPIEPAALQRLLENLKEVRG